MAILKRFIRKVLKKTKPLNPEIFDLIKQGNRAALLIYLNYCNDTRTKLDYAFFKEGLFTSAKEGDSDSMYDIGYFYLNGTLTFVQDEQLAMEWFLKAAEKNHTNAMNQLAYSYLKGRGVSADNKKMLQWYLRSAELGNTDAMTNVGNIYAQGQGVNKDFVKAHYYFNKAAELGNSNAMNNLAYLYQHGLGIEQSEEKAQEWLQKSIEVNLTQSTNKNTLPH